LQQILIELSFETLNDSKSSLKVRENDDRTISEMIFCYVQSEIKSHYLFEIDRDLNDRSQINLFLDYHDKDHVQRRRNDCHRKCFDVIVDVDVVREYDQMTALVHDLIVSDYRDFCRADDDDSRIFSSKDHRREDSEPKSIEIFIEDCSVSYFQLL
jgi:hypothetical protein